MGEWMMVNVERVRTRFVRTNNMIHLPDCQYVRSSTVAHEWHYGDHADLSVEALWEWRGNNEGLVEPCAVCIGKLVEA